MLKISRMHGKNRCSVPLHPARMQHAALFRPCTQSLSALVLRFYRQPHHAVMLDSAKQRIAATTTSEALLDDMCLLHDCHSQVQFPTTLPVFPCTPNEALAPGCTKVLHLYEDKDLELLEAVMSGKISQGVSDSCDDLQAHEPLVPLSGSKGLRGVFVHSSIEMGSPRTPCGATASSSPGALVQGGFVFFLSTLVKVVDVRCAGHGGLQVTIRGEGRVRLTRLKQLNPYITGEVWPVLDVVPLDVLETTSNGRQWPVDASTSDTAQLLEINEHDTGLGGSSPPSEADSSTPTIHELDPGVGQTGDGNGGGGESENDAMCDNTGDEDEDGACLGGPAEAADFPDGRERPDVEAASGAGAGWVLRAMVQELRQVTKDVHAMLVRMDRHEAAQQLTAALQWADDPAPFICNLGTGAAAAHLYMLQPQASMTTTTTTSTETEQSLPLCSSLETRSSMTTAELGPNGGTAAVGGILLPCAVSHLERATRLSFALLTLAQGAGGIGWTGGAAAADPVRAALCILDTSERLQIVTTAAKSMRARLAAQSALRRLRISS